MAPVNNTCTRPPRQLTFQTHCSASHLAQAARPSLSPPTEHPRFGSVHFEEHHLVAGPTRKEAAKVRWGSQLPGVRGRGPMLVQLPSTWLLP
jgi:hypothetical protein